MIENLVDVWLTEASERSYEAAFGQLLVIEGYRVVQGPMHHAYEHGKDIIAWDPTGDLCVYQLKGGKDNLNLAGVEKVQDQLLAAAAAVVTHPSLPSPRPPDRVFLVTNQVATGPAQDRIHVLSEGNHNRGLAPLHLVEHAELVSRFVEAEKQFFPSSPAALNVFYSLYAADGRGELPRHDFFRLLEEVLPLKGPKCRASDAGRAIAAAALITVLALRRWADSSNHAELAMGWICYATQVLRLAEKNRLGRIRWHKSYRLALEEARRHARRLLEEAVTADDLLIPDLAESVVYGARAVKVCGLASAFTLSERIEHGTDHAYRGIAGKLVVRELDYFQILGEVQAPEYFLSILAVREAGEYRIATSMLLSWVASVARANQIGSTVPLPSPYRSVEEIILDRLPPRETIIATETFAGSAYTVQVGVRWAVRRLWRQTLNAVWSDVSRLNHYSVEPAGRSDYLAPTSSQGKLRSWFYPIPTSWSELLAEAEEHDFSALPSTLLACPEFVPFFCLALPHRFNGLVPDLLDRLAVTGSVP